MAITAKYAGFCPNCNKRFVVGRDLIEKKDGGKWAHVNCPTPALPQQITESKKYSTSINVPLSIEEHPIGSDFDGLGDALAEVSKEEIIIEAKDTFVPSKYQQDFFDALLETVSNRSAFQHIVVEAVAGSGKTTTLIHGIKRVKQALPELSICIVAFNKHIATEFQNKLASMLGNDHSVLASTKHSLGLRAIRKTYSKLKVDDDKVGSFLEAFWPVSKQALNEGKITKNERKVHYIKRIAMRNLVSICKSVLVDVLDANAVLNVIDRYGVEIDSNYVDELIERLPHVMQLCRDNPELVDFDDMGWLPIVLDLDIEKFDLLLIDEAQDMSNGDMEFLFRCVKKDGHIVAVGDRFQSLYGFRGADTDAIPNIISMLKAQVLPLSVTYRCPVSHVELAKAIVPQLEARDDAPTGSVIDIDYLNLVSTVQPGDMVICRTNAPLIRPAFECIRGGKKAVIRGKDIGSTLVNLIKRFETNDLGQFQISLSEYFEHEYSKLLDKGREMQAILLKDRVDTLFFICNECSTVAELMSKIELLFSDSNVGVVFSSVHRAKGLEAKNVFLLRPDLMPHPKAKKDWEAQQELNGKYVAQTRSKENLYFVRGGENV